VTARRGHERYRQFDRRRYHRKGLSYLLYRAMGDRVILPQLAQIRGQEILEVGLGAGYYTELLLENGNQVTGIDANPHMGEHLPVTIHEARADDFSRHIGQQSVDVVASFWMTEYLSPREVTAFVREAMVVLRPGGLFLSTFVADRGWGWFYRTASRVRGITKYGYHETEMAPLLKGRAHEIKSIPGRLGLPYAFMVMIRI
jgi:SAM-dependent methyltransferase